MTDVFVALAFMTMVITPCVVALRSGVVTGADLGVRDLAELLSEHPREAFIPR